MQNADFSYDQLPAHLSDKQKFDLWCDYYRTNVSSIDFRISDAPFSARLEFASFRASGLGYLSGTIVGTAHGKAHASSAARDQLGLFINAGTAAVQVRSCDRETVLLPGGAALVSPIDAEDFTSNGTDNSWFLLYLPRAAVLRAMPRAEDLIGTPVRPDNDVLRMISGYTALVLREGVRNPRLGEHVEQTFIDLVTLALGCEKDTTEIAAQRGLKSVRLEAILQAIARNFRDPLFSVGRVAQKLRVSERYIQDILQPTGSGFSERVMELRLQHASRLLARADARQRKVSDIAFSSGFNDLSYFHRAFRRRFGMSPGGARIMD